jgi:glutamyl-tRNA reductase
VLSREQVIEARRVRRGAPLFIIDIAVPRDVDPEVNKLDNIYLYDIDGLQSVVQENLRERERAAELARRRIEREVEGFDRWRQSLQVTPTIVALRSHMLSMARREVERFRRRLGRLSTEQQQTIDEMTRSLVQKMLHRPVAHLRRSVERGDVDASTAVCRDLFGLEESPKDEPAGDSDAGRGPQRLLKGGRDS